MKTGYGIIEAFERQDAEFEDDDGYVSLEEIIDSTILETREEQDKLTRHACAEAVVTFQTEDPAWILKDTAHRLCMNVQAF